ncbi:MAG: hypothetical protein GWM98_13245 [Nitrospinaceae bacterium]|nr:hypothetical protein [Nitrospinaceae bacterium]NIR55256.1 hypothetical protein [Nitrospinaceae bacterium]NIS85694.1 hypothetical protein [Nitrospinaceae bacterium]NIT82545.1 hypothetical protein [Nitrospinaceae bacterium]NIU44749.1 hypothetical protein [Nitrospinaceae bacterium]
MHEVRVYDSSGALKKVISEKVLQERADRQFLYPSAYARGRKKAKGQPANPSKKNKQAKSA